MIYYKRSSIDPDMPPYSIGAGTLITLLDYLLVTVMGWTKPFSGTNLAVYKQPAGTNGYYLRIDDTNSVYARAVGYETMSDVNTGTNMFPTDVQMPGGFYIKKPSLTGDTKKRMTFISNGSMFYIIGHHYQSYTEVFGFGDIFSYKTGDVWNTMIVGSITSDVSTTSFDYASPYAVSALSTSYPLYILKNHSGSNVSELANKIHDGKSNSSALQDPAQLQRLTEATIDGKVWVSPIWVLEANQIIRGVLPGIWVTSTKSAALDFGGRFTIGNRVFEQIPVYVEGTTLDAYLIEVSDTWGGVYG